MVDPTFLALNHYWTLFSLQIFPSLPITSFSFIIYCQTSSTRHSFYSLEPRAHHHRNLVVGIVSLILRRYHWVVVNSLPLLLLVFFYSSILVPLIYPPSCSCLLSLPSSICYCCNSSKLGTKLIQSQLFINFARFSFEKVARNLKKGASDCQNRRLEVKYRIFASDGF